VAGALGGGTIGYNYQFPSSWVIGVEGDLGATNLRGSRGCTTLQAGFAVPLNCQYQSNWMATAAARVGYSWGRTLYYVKGGGAWTEERVNVSCDFGPLNGAIINGFPVGPCANPSGGATNGFNTSGHRSGWLLGYGAEFDLGRNWSAKAEYDYIDFGSRTGLANDGVTLVRDSGALSQVKVGVNYRFSGPAAVVAKY
jgi:opacity protein-like surface antigen